ncbi:alpha-1,2-fucosyltransferase [Mucilaginibacter rigui]|uniref:Alpha-1,2-fucosyltransferase n=1 Tax=Mucilaginibacter rigui TaxID=534635 RepID=A0ABR7XAY8_9SPHI|nr:alpha-1,2-fucosyltransferase [Mucilaginibacter rigui]MBD1386775.1 alpha-1,2-fucosyltransferase [Mucilaginibacter rigui]
MIIVKLQGGLGNQMFQYAAAAGLNKGKICLDLSFLRKHNKSTPTFTARKFELAVFPNLKANLVNRLVSKTLDSRKVIHRLIKKMLFPGLTTITDATENKQAAGQRIGHKTIYLDGYFQNENNFKHIRQELLKRFEFPVLKGPALTWSKKIQIDDNSVSIHVRRSDYLKPHVNNFHGVLPLSYYQKAKSIIAGKIKAPQYYIFSDDPEWCAANFSFPDNPALIIKNTSNAWEDMCLMSQCKHHIIANSSYSWWAAWLNQNENKIVIAPDKWFVQEPADIVPETWIKI